jgi:hypothetical protein
LAELLPEPADSSGAHLLPAPVLLDVVLGDGALIPLLEPAFTSDSITGFTEVLRFQGAGRDDVAERVPAALPLTEVYGFEWPDPPRLAPQLDSSGREMESAPTVRLHLKDGSLVTIDQPMRAGASIVGLVRKWARPASSRPRYWTNPDYRPPVGVSLDAVETFDTLRLTAWTTEDAEARLYLIGFIAVAVVGMVFIFACAGKDDPIGCRE